MATRINTANITDELIKPALTDSSKVFTEADRYLENIAKRLGVAVVDIPSTLSYEVEKLLVAFVCKQTCLDKSDSAGAAFQGQSSENLFTSKLPYYDKLLSALESNMTADMLKDTVTTTEQSIGAITLVRA